MQQELHTWWRERGVDSEESLPRDGFPVCLLPEGECVPTMVGGSTCKSVPPAYSAECCGQGSIVFS